LRIGSHKGIQVPKDQLILINHKLNMYHQVLNIESYPTIIFTMTLSHCHQGHHYVHYVRLHLHYNIFYFRSR